MNTLNDYKGSSPAFVLDDKSECRKLKEYVATFSDGSCRILIASTHQDAISMSKYIATITRGNVSSSPTYINSVIKTRSEEEIDAIMKRIVKEEFFKVFNILDYFNIFVNMKSGEFFECNTISDTDHMQFVIEILRLKNKVHDDYRIASIRFQLIVDIANELFKTEKQTWKNSDFSPAELKISIELSARIATRNIEEATQSASEKITDAVNDATDMLMAILDKYKTNSTESG